MKKDDLKSFKQANAYPIHMSTNPGILDLDIDSVNESYVVSGARDGQAIVFDLNKQTVVNKFHPYGKKSMVSLVKLMPGLPADKKLAILGSDSGLGGLWDLDAKKLVYGFDCHKGAKVTDVSF